MNIEKQIEMLDKLIAIYQANIKRLEASLFESLEAQREAEQRRDALIEKKKGDGTK